MKRAALYIRVSTEEQALHGYSLDAQRDNLTEFAKKHNMLIVDYYVDEGASARKKYTTRKEFMRMLDDIQAGLIDIILFIKMDRWFRSVADYYKVQEILDKHKVDWKATMEDYDTSTSSGRLNLNIRLSIAQNESEMTSDRIKFVFQNKKQRGELINASHPYGFKIENKKLVIDEDAAPIVKDIFNRYSEGETMGGIIRYYRGQGLSLTRTQLRDMLQNRIFIGELYQHKGAIDALVKEEEFYKVQKLLKRNPKNPPTKRVYTFSGLIVCDNCGFKMNGRYARDSIYYRCRHYVEHRSCPHKALIRQDVLERYLLESVRGNLETYICDKTIELEKPKIKKIDTAKIKKQMERLKELFVNDLIDMDTYKRDYSQLSEQLQKAQETPRMRQDIDRLKKILETNFETTYLTLPDSGKQQFWRSVISEIRVDSMNNIDIYFL